MTTTLKTLKESLRKIRLVIARPFYREVVSEAYRLPWGPALLGIVCSGCTFKATACLTCSQSTDTVFSGASHLSPVNEPNQRNSTGFLIDNVPKLCEPMRLQDCAARGRQRTFGNKRPKRATGLSSTFGVRHRHHSIVRWSTEEGREIARAGLGRKRANFATFANPGFPLGIRASLLAESAIQ